MTRLATSSNPAFEVLDLELRRPGPSYTVDTLRELRAAHPGQRLWFLIGADAFAELETWHRPGELLELASLAVLPRPGSAERPLASLLPEHLRQPLRATRAGLEHPSGEEIRGVAVSALAISASDLRRRVACGASIRYLVPDSVADYIEKHGLYQEDP
jgi:nicotinate-nucleotide adenylyltransferase